MARTVLRYLEDFDVISCEAEVTAVREHEDGRTIVELNDTCFYPRGGGQDWDTGTITSGGDIFEVEEVRLDEEGIVLHIGNPAVPWKPGAKTYCHVNELRRQDNTRLHSAGHLVDMAMSELRPDWVPGKGAHYPHMSFVEYDTPEVPADELVTQLENKIAHLQKGNFKNKILFVPVDEMAKYCRHVPANIPTNKPARVVLYGEDFGVPCGGTHVKQLADIGTVNITKIKAKKGVVKVSYAVEGIN